MAKPAPKPAPEGKHVQLFKMRRKVGKGFYSAVSNAPDGHKGVVDSGQLCGEMFILQIGVAVFPTPFV